MKKLLISFFLSSSVIWAGGGPSIEVQPPANLIDCPSSDDELVNISDDPNVKRMVKRSTLPSFPSVWHADQSAIVESTPVTRQIRRDREHKENMPSYTKLLRTIFPILIVAAIMNKLLNL